DPVCSGRTCDRREDSLPRPLLAARQSRPARPPCRTDGGRRRPDAVRRRDPRRRLPPAHPIDTAALCDRLRHPRAVGRLLLLQRTEGQVMTLAHERTSQFFEGMRQERRQILTPEGVPIPVELADHGERLTAFVLDLFIWILLPLAIYIPVLSLISYTRG